VAVSEKPQIEALRTGCDVLVATPGRLLDLAQQTAPRPAPGALLRAGRGPTRMLDMGFINDIRRS